MGFVPAAAAAAVRVVTAPDATVAPRVDVNRSKENMMPGAKVARSSSAVTAPAKKHKKRVTVSSNSDDRDDDDDRDLADIKMLLQKHNNGKKAEAQSKARERARVYESKRAKPGVVAVREWEKRTGGSYGALSVAEREAANEEIRAAAQACA